MTTSIDIVAHCTSDTVVKIQTNDLHNPQPDVIIEDQDNYQTVVFDGRSVTISEIPRDMIGKC